MTTGHYTGPRRITWDTGGCTEHVTQPRPSWQEAGKRRTLDTRHASKLTVRPHVNPHACQRVNPRTGWYGVTRRASGRYQARFKHKGAVHHVGIYDTDLQAARAHDTYCQREGIDRKLNRDLRPEAFEESA